MQYTSTTFSEYISQLPPERIEVITKLIQKIRSHIPKGFAEEIQYGMPSFIVPFSIYPSGYHCDNKIALPFISVASQKNFISLYHMGIYANTELYNWFVNAYQCSTGKLPDMGKSCIRFKKPELIPFELIGELCEKMNVQEWINLYESKFKK